MIQNLKAYAQFLRLQLETKGYLLTYLVGVLVICVALNMRGCSPPPPVPTATPVLAQVNPEVKHADKVDTPIMSPKKTVRTYPASAKGLITLPRAVADNDAQLVTDSTVLAASEKRQIITQVLDVGTGETSSYVSAAPDPWIAVEDRGALSVDYGFKRGSFNPVGRVNLRQDFLQTKSVHWGASASVYSDLDWFAGVGGEVRW